jgi:bla regulator protein blaR1
MNLDALTVAMAPLGRRAIALAFPAGPILVVTGLLLRRWPAARHAFAGLVVLWLMVPVSLPWTWSASSALGPAAPALLVEVSPGRPALSLVAVLWLAGSALVALRLRARRREWRGVADRATPWVGEACLPVRCAGVRVVVSQAAAGPFTIGWRRPVVVLPAALVASGDMEGRDAALRHEMAHVRRRDDLRVLAELAVRAVYFFHPVVWLLLSWRHADRERLCDREALRSATSPAAYARGLLAAVRCGVTGIQVAGLGARRDLERRLREIADGRAARSGSPLLAAAVALLAAALALPSDAAEALLRLPVAGARLSSPFGPRTDPISDRPDRHQGIDLAAPRGEPVVAALDGEVVEAVRGRHGRTIVVQHGGGLRTVYAQLADIAARPGQHVRQGQTIGTVGSSGPSTGPHLHFEAWKDGTAVDPVPLLAHEP